jgi:hypothetical protein
VVIGLPELGSVLPGMVTSLMTVCSELAKVGSSAAAHTTDDLGTEQAQDYVLNVVEQSVIGQLLPPLKILTN